MSRSARFHLRRNRILKYYSYVKQRLYKLVVPKRTAEVICTIVTYTQDVVPFCSVRKRVSLFSGLGITVFVIVTHIGTICCSNTPRTSSDADHKEYVSGFHAVIGFLHSLVTCIPRNPKRTPLLLIPPFLCLNSRPLSGYLNRL